MILAPGDVLKEQKRIFVVAKTFLVLLVWMYVYLFRDLVFGLQVGLRDIEQANAE